MNGWGFAQREARKEDTRDTGHGTRCRIRIFEASIARMCTQERATTCSRAQTYWAMSSEAWPRLDATLADCTTGARALADCTTGLRQDKASVSLPSWLGLPLSVSLPSWLGLPLSVMRKRSMACVFGLDLSPPLSFFCFLRSGPSSVRHRPRMQRAAHECVADKVCA